MDLITAKLVQFSYGLLVNELISCRLRVIKLLFGQSQHLVADQLMPFRVQLTPVFLLHLLTLFDILGHCELSLLLTGYNFVDFVLILIRCSR